MLCTTALAAPYRPTDDALVLEKLPASAGNAASRGALSADVAAQLAQIHITRARSSGDPRELGYAEGVLRAWWSAPMPTPRILLLRATLKQARHDFSGALTDLDALLAREPQDAQALLTRATILRVQGRYPEALDACAGLTAVSDAFTGALCTQSVSALHGELPAARATLDALLPLLTRQPQGVAAWFDAERADMAVRAGDTETAAALYGQAVQTHPADLDLRAAYADLLLEQNAPRRVLALIDADTAVDALRLRRALALHALGDDGFAALDVSLRAGFAAAHRRGEALHLREEVRYRLAIGDAPAALLPLAAQNWKTQREPWDARLLLHAANAAAKPEAAQPVREWLRETRLEDARLEMRP